MQNNLTLNDCLEDYYAQRRGRYSDSTWKAHEGFLERLREWVTRETQPNVWLTDIDERLMRRYFDRLRPPAYSPSTFNNYRQYANAFWKYCREESWTSTNPMRHVDPMRPQKKVRLRLSADELLAMLDDASPRDRIALALGMNTALRGGDIVALTVGSVNLGDDTLTAWEEKTDTETILPITDDLHDELVRWFVHYAETTGTTVEALPNTWPLVPAAYGAAINVHDPTLGFRVVYKTGSRLTHPERIVQAALARLGHETKGNGFHVLRRSAARHLHDRATEEGHPDAIRIAQALLGHASQRTTEIYLGITHEKQRRDAIMRGKAFLRPATESAGDAGVGRTLQSA